MNASSQSLYDRWLRVLEREGEREALVVMGSGQGFSFAELAAMLDKRPRASGPVVAEAEGLDFVLETLRAWRDGVPLVPLESGSSFDEALLAGLPADVAQVKQTSGTTGVPRLVLFSGAQMAADADQIVATMGLGDHGKNIAVISLAHSYGFSNLVLPLLLHGLPLVLAQSPLPAAVDAALAESGGDAILPAVPAMWKAWLGAGILDPQRIGLAISAGAPLTLELERAVADSAGIKIHNFLGSSECGGIAYDRSAERRYDAAGLVGTPMERVRVALGEGGVLAVESPAVGMRYWPADEPEILGGGRFVTADLAELDAFDGIRLLGRAGETINVAGRKVSPGEIESALARVEGVEHCVVFGIPSADPQRVEDIVACVKGCAAEAELRRSLATQLANWKVPRRWWMCAELEPNTRGKISRKDWREQYLNR